MSFRKIVRTLIEFSYPFTRAWERLCFHQIEQGVFENCVNSRQKWGSDYHGEDFDSACPIYWNLLWLWCETIQD